MFMIRHIVYTCAMLAEGRVFPMATNRVRSHKHFRLDAVKIKRAKRLLRAETETEAIDKALDMAISECERNRLAEEANDVFLSSGAEIKDVYGVLDE